MNKISKLTKTLTRNLCTKCNKNNCLCKKQWQSHLATDSEQIVKAEKDQHPYDNHLHPDKHIPELKTTNTIRHIQDNQIQHQKNLEKEISETTLTKTKTNSDKLPEIKDKIVEQKKTEEKRNYYKYQYEDCIFTEEEEE